MAVEYVQVCKDCKTAGRTGKPLAAEFPGPRCYTCNRKFKKAQRARTHERYVAKTYGLTDGQYNELYLAQGGRCAICRVATGKTKKLAVDHDHVTNFVRGLLCGPCNQMIGTHNIEALRRAVNYLESPPAFDVIGKVKP